MTDHDHLASFRNRRNIDHMESDDMDRHLLELSALFEISQTLNSSLNLKSILNNVLLVPMGRMMIGKGLILIKKDVNIFTIENIKGLPHKLQGKEIDLTGIPDHSFLLSVHIVRYDSTQIISPGAVLPAVFSRHAAKTRPRNPLLFCQQRNGSRRYHLEKMLKVAIHPIRLVGELFPGVL